MTAPSLPPQAGLPLERLARLLSLAAELRPGRLVPERLKPDWTRGYGSGQMLEDGLAAIIVTLMLVPQGMAYAMLAGLPPQVGLYASIVPLVAYALFGSSPTLAVGPVAVISLMTAASLSHVAPAGTPEYVVAAQVLALLSGLVLAGMALLRLGFVADFLSHAVISGFISASGILIAAGQIKHLLGIPAGGSTLPEMAVSLAANATLFNPWTAALGALALALLLWAKNGLKPLLLRAGMNPRAAGLLARTGPVLAVAVTTAIVAAYRLQWEGVKTVGAIPAGLPSPSVPLPPAGLWLDLLPAAILIALVGFVESVSVAQTLAARRRQRIDCDRELAGLGAANVAAAVTGGYPVTGGFARSVVNFEAGAATQMAGVLTALGIALASLTLTPLTRTLPQAALAAIIVVAVLQLVDLESLRRSWETSKEDFAAQAATMLTVLNVGVEAGIIVGVALSVGLFLWRSSRPTIAIVGQVPGTEQFRDVDRQWVVQSPTVLGVRIDGSLYFANARWLEERVQSLVAARPAVREVVLLCQGVAMVDASAVHALHSLADRLRAAGIALHLSEVREGVMERMIRCGLPEHLTGRVFVSQAEAMRCLDPETSALAARSLRQRGTGAEPLEP
ncbi:MAG TPA: sulfate permease [Azospirillaceae bacterium]|nr:sulfate permease [Azospirillaceae bacterium]